MSLSLFDLVVEKTGLPKEVISKELLEQIKKKGIDESSLTIEVLRSILTEYLQDVFLKAKETFSE